MTNVEANWEAAGLDPRIAQQPCLGERIDGVWDSTWCGCQGCRDYNHELEEG